MSQPESYDHSRASTRRNVDRTVTVLLMVALAVLVPLASVSGLFAGMAPDGCIGGEQCSSTVVTLGLGIAAASPWVVYVVALALVVMRWVRRRSTWWVPLAALVVGAVLWALGGFVAISAIG